VIPCVLSGLQGKIALLLGVYREGGFMRLTVQCLVHRKYAECECCRAATTRPKDCGRPYHRNTSMTCADRLLQKTGQVSSSSDPLSVFSPFLDPRFPRQFTVRSQGRRVLGPFPSAAATAGTWEGGRHTGRRAEAETSSRAMPWPCSSDRPVSRTVSREALRPTMLVPS